MTVTDGLRWLLTLPLLLVSVLFILVNLRVLVLNLRSNLNAGPAPFTLVGGLSGSIALLLLPVGDLGERIGYLWVPLFADLGTAPWYLAMLVLALWQRMHPSVWRHD